MMGQTRKISFSRLFALAWLALTLLSGGALAQEASEESAGPRVSDKAAIEDLLKDQTVYGRYTNGESWSEYHAPDGRTAFRLKNCTYAGHWWVADGLVCFRYDAFSHGKEICYRLHRQGDRLEFYIRGVEGVWWLSSYSVDRRPGNPDKMSVEGEACVGV